MFPFLLDGALLEFVVSTPKIGEFSLQFAVAFKAFRGKSPIANRGLNLTLGLAFMTAVAEVAIGRERIDIFEGQLQSFAALPHLKFVC